MRDGNGGATGWQAREERRYRTKLAIDEFTEPTMDVDVYGNGRGVHVIQVTLLSVPGSWIKDGWTLLDYKTNKGEQEEKRIHKAIKAIQRRSDIVKVVWSSSALAEHMERMKSQKFV